MNGIDVFVDTNVLLYLLNGDKAAAEMLEDANLHVSFVTELELLSFPKLTVGQRNRIAESLAECRLHDLTAKTKENTIAIRKEHGLKLPDAIIAATALTHDLPLLTADKKFERISIERRDVPTEITDLYLAKNNK